MINWKTVFKKLATVYMLCLLSLLGARWATARLAELRRPKVEWGEPVAGKSTSGTELAGKMNGEDIVITYSSEMDHINIPTNIDLRMVKARNERATNKIDWRF